VGVKDDDEPDVADGLYDTARALQTAVICRVTGSVIQQKLVVLM
jgi:hypothetical protein